MPLNNRRHAIVTGQDSFGLSFEQKVRADWQAAVQHRVAGNFSEPPAIFPDVRGTVPAQINWSRWVVTCPACNSAETVTPNDFYWCCECGSVENDGAPYRVIFPQRAQQIVAVLMKRSDYRTRNWQQGETVDQLRAVNKAAGIEV